MNKGLLTIICFLLVTTISFGQNPSGDLRIELLNYNNLAVDRYAASANSSSPCGVYIAVQFCNDGGNDLNDVFAYIGDYSNNTPGVYPTTTASGSVPYSGTFSFSQEAGESDGTRFIGTIPAGECVVQYWYLGYNIVDANGNILTGEYNNRNDNLSLSYDVWATADDGGTFREAEDGQTLTLRPTQKMNSSRVWPGNANHVPDVYKNAFSQYSRGWRQQAGNHEPGSTFVVEGIWFKMPKIDRGFDNDGDYQKDYNFMLQPVGNPSLYDPECFRLVKTNGLVVVKYSDGSFSEIEFEDEMCFEDIPSNNNAAFGMIFYEFAPLNGPCSTDLTPYISQAKGNRRERYNGDFSTEVPMSSSASSVNFQVTAPGTTIPSGLIEIGLEATNASGVSIGHPEYGASLVFQQEIPSNTYYVAGSADDNNTLPSGVNATVLYSIDNGDNWTETEPLTAQAVTNIQWWLDGPVPNGDNAIVTFDLFVSPSYSAATLLTGAGISVGSAAAFKTDAATIAIDQGLTITDIIFLDNGDGNVIVGDGVQEGSEPGLGNVSVTIYNDVNGDGELDNGDLQVAQTTSASDGTYEFTGLAAGDYLIEVDLSDTDIPTGFTNTTPAVYSVSSSGTPSAPFGFINMIDITNTLVSGATVFEDDYIDYQLQIQNLTYTEDTDNSSTVIAWASQLDPGNEFNYHSNNLLGPPDVQLSWPSYWARQAKVRGFDFSGETGTIEKVEIVISICLDYSVYNDYLQISFRREDGTTAYAPNPVLSSNSTPSLNDYVGPPNIGWLILDVTDQQNWDWDIFDSNWAVTMDGTVVNSSDGSIQYTDAIGVRITSSCCASPNGEPSTCERIMDPLPLEYDFDQTKLAFVSSVPAASSVSNGTVYFDNLGPLYPNELTTIDFTFQALDPADPDSTVTVAVIAQAENCDGMVLMDVDTAGGVTIVNKGSVSGYVFGDVDGDGWIPTLGYESGTDNFLPGVEVRLYGCFDDFNPTELLYPAPYDYKRCTHHWNDGHWQLVKRDTTDENGFYSMSGINNGYYYMEVNQTTVPNASEQTADPDYTNGVANSWADGRWKNPNEDCRDVGIIGIGNDHANVNFGYHVAAAISGMVWDDVNGDGVKDNNEPTIPNVSVELTHSGCTAGSNCSTVTTNGQGIYNFNDVPANVDYAVTIDLNSVQGADSWTITFESDGTTDNSNAVSVASGQQIFNVDFGLQASGDLDIAGTVYYDWSGNAHQNAGDEGIPNIMVRLYRDNNANGVINGSDQLVNTYTTGSDGTYAFNNKPSDNYIVAVEENTLTIFPHQTEDPDEYGPCTVCDAKTSITTTDDNFNISVSDVWNYVNSSWSGCEICDEAYTSTTDNAYENNNLDHINFTDPLGSSSVCVTEIAVRFRVAASDLEKSTWWSYTDQVNRDYPIELNGVQIGTFDPVEKPFICAVCEDITVIFPVDLSTIPYNYGGTNTLDVNFFSLNDALPYSQQQDICVADIRMEFIASNCVTDYTDLDFGYQPTGGTGEIEGFAFLDENGNGLASSGEPRLGHIEARLEVDLNNDGVFFWIETTVTDANGDFTFDELVDGTYRVIISETDTDIPTDHNGALARLTTLGTQTVAVSSGEMLEVNALPCTDGCLDERPAFGFAMPGSALGYIFSDNNGDGTVNEKEQGMGGIQLFICNAADGYCDATNALYTVTSSSGGITPLGFFEFVGLDAGTYTIAVDQASLPSGYLLTADPNTNGFACYSPLDLSDPNYSLLNANCDHADVGFNVSLGSQYSGAYFGYQPPGVVGGTVWFDDDEDGILDEDEDGLEEVTVEITNVTPITVESVNYNAGEYTLLEVTDVDGQYVFTNLPDGTYDVDVDVLTDYVLTYDADGGLDGITRVVLNAGRVTSADNTWCTEADCSQEVNFGMSPDFINTLAGVVCLDEDEDGRCDTGGETFPDGTLVNILDLDGNEYGETTVALDGTFFFDNLPTTDMVVSVSKTVAPLRLTTLTTSLGDTPAYDIEDSENNAIQFVAVSGNVIDMHYGFTFSDTFDLGDLPSPYVSKVNRANAGPAHIIPASPTLYLGSLIDAEPRPRLNSRARGDDNNGLDDEDGITFTDASTWTATAGGGSLTADVMGDGYLIGYGDFNDDGDFDDAGEMIINEAVSTGSINYNFDVPSGTVLSGGQDFYFRFRLFRNAPFSPATAYNGITEEGEVEDYRVSVCKNLTIAGEIEGGEIGCDGFDPTDILETVPAEGGGGDIEYIWEESTDGGLTWVAIAGATGQNYNPPSVSGTKRFRRGARRSKCTDYQYTNTISKTVVSNYTDAGIIAGNEENCGIYDPDIILNVVAPSGGTGTSTPFYQWEQSTDSLNWNPILNANEEYLDPGVISQTTYYRRTARKTPCGIFLISNVITKMVSVNYVDAGEIGGNESVCGTFDPTEITSTTLPSGGVDGYEVLQWEESTNDGGSWTEIPGATSATYNPGLITQTTWYRRKGRRIPCTVWVNSNVVRKTVKPFPVANIVTYPISASGFLCELTDYEYDAEDAGSNVDYVWDFSSYGTPSTALGQGPHFIEFDVPDGDALTSTLVTLTTTKDGCVSTDNRPLTLRPEIQITDVVTFDPSACQFNDGALVIQATFPSGTNVEYSINGGLSWQTSNSFPNQGAGVYEVQVRYQGGDCAESYGAVALSDPPPEADILLSAMEECTGQTIVIEAIPITGNPVFTWTFGNGAIPSTIAGPGPHSVYFTTGGFASIAVTMDENNCIGVRDTIISIVDNYNEGGTILGGETLCSTYDPSEIVGGSNPSGGTGGTLVYQWEYREDNGSGGYTAWQDIIGANAESYDPGIIAATTEFRRKARRAPCADWVASNSVIARLVEKPQLGDDTYFTVCPGFPHADNVSSNDFNLVNPTFTLIVFPTNGTLDFEADGEFIYDPSSTYCGTDEFQYMVCNDGTSCCDTAHVLIDLTDTNPPTILNVPDNIVISCDDQIPVADAVDIIEDCQTVSIGTDEFTTQGTDSCSLNNYLISRIWNGVDYCSNTAAAQQTITIQDATAPDIFRIYTLPNGRKMVAGVMENVSNYWKTVSLPIQFASPPVILAQVTTRNDYTPVATKLRNVSTTQFQLKLKEEEGNDDMHGMENVAWVAFEPGTFSENNAFEVGSWLMTSTPNYGVFTETFSSVPEFFATIQSNNEGDPAVVRTNNLSTTGLDIWVEEETSSDGETDHILETIGYLAIETTGSLTNDQGEVIGEIGRVDLTSADLNISLANEYHNPVVIIGALTTNESDPVTARVTSVSSSSFSVQLQEWDYLDGVHAAESVSYLVVEGSLPLNKTIACDEIPAPLKIGTEIIAVDNCDATIKLIMTEDNPGFDCLTDTTYTRSWYTTDDCGNVTQLTETHILEDIVPPTFTAPDNLTIVCSDDKDNLLLTGNVDDENDNCSEFVSMTYSDDETNLVGCNGHIIRNWKGVDDCGNITEKVQIIYVSPEKDSDNDGIVDYFDHDDDNDGIPDVVETNEDSDGDGIPNDLDLDSDNDGAPDLIETGGVDSNGDGVIDIVGEDNWDSDNDGFAYGYDGNDIDTSLLESVVFDPLSPTHDRDGDSVPNYLDHDSDNDAIPDLIELGGVDTNGDGIIDYPILSDPTSMADNDSDGFYDVYDPDVDDIPGIENPDAPLIVYDGEDYTGNHETILPDSDGDGVPDFLDSDSDNDGTGDLIEVGGIDINGDGRLELNANFVDLDNDGFSDIYVTFPLILTSEDGSEEDGRPEDTDGDGTAYESGDADFDGSPNHTDHDSDNDNILDILETGLSEYDGDNDGVWDNWSDDNLNGFDDIAEATGNIMTEDDGIIVDGVAEDSGDDDETSYLSAQPDGTFAETNGNPDIDDDGDGILNFLDEDSDNDLLPDSVEDSNFNNTQDEGETDLYNPDSDFDLILDGVEDHNLNGIYDPGETDPLNPNTDGDSFNDGEEDINHDGVLDPIESDPTNACDPIIHEACRGIVLDVRINLMGALIDQDSMGRMRDDLRYYGKLPEYEPYSGLPHLVHIGQDQFPNLDDLTNGGISGDSTEIYNPYGNPNDNHHGIYKEWSNPYNFYMTGNDAPVDWVMIELRSAINKDSVLATRACLLQRDGDVRDVDGISYLTFDRVPSGSYYVAVRHRNHLGVMTENPHLLSPAVTTIDFTDPATEVYGDYSRINLGNDKMALWAGDLNGDGYIIYQGPWNDVLNLFSSIVLAPDNDEVLANFIVTGYDMADFNMDGNVIYQGPGNDKAKLLINTTLAAPDNVLGLANFVLIEKLP